jgi:hypothetical protein
MYIYIRPNHCQNFSNSFIPISINEAQRTAKRYGVYIRYI